MRTIRVVIIALFLSCNLAVAQDTLYVYKAGAVVYKSTVSSIDSIAFHKKYSTTPTIPTTVTDIDGNVYHTVTIGTQTWMVENLKTIKYNDGTSVPNVTDNIAWSNLTTGAYCNYNTDADYVDTYGRLYNWYAVNTSKLAPKGWHVATYSEWETLINYVSTHLGVSISVAKALTATTNWVSDTGINTVGNNCSINNSSGFSAMPSGNRSYFKGLYNNINSWGIWWCSTLYDNSSAWEWGIGSSSKDIVHSYTDNRDGCSVRCIKNTSNIPSVTTTTVSVITETTAISGGDAIIEGETPITSRGICWSTKSSPTIDDSKTLDGTGVGPFVSQIKGLTPNTTYYVRAYATNSAGTEYGSQESFTSGTMVTDIDGNTYHTVIIGKQTWMVENLRTTKYNDDTTIPLVINGSIWFSQSGPAYCWYNNDADTYKNTYGALYNWYAVNSGKLAPAGWHIPSNTEWSTLERYVSVNLRTLGSAAKALASATEWATDTKLSSPGCDLSKNNSSGFTGLPSGYRIINGSPDGSFINAGWTAAWWSSSKGDSSDDQTAWCWDLKSYNSDIYSFSKNMDNGFSVRCVKDN